MSAIDGRYFTRFEFKVSLRYILNSWGWFCRNIWTPLTGAWFISCLLCRFGLIFLWKIVSCIKYGVVIADAFNVAIEYHCVHICMHVQWGTIRVWTPNLVQCVHPWLSDNLVYEILYSSPNSDIKSLIIIFPYSFCLDIMHFSRYSS